MTKQVDENKLEKSKERGESNTQVPCRCPCSAESCKVESIVFTLVGLHTRAAAVYKPGPVFMKNLSANSAKILRNVDVSS